MIETLWQRLDLGARHTLPFATTLLCAFLSVIPWPLPYFGTVTPPLVLITLYYWSVHRPDLFRPWVAFFIGLLHDIINYLPIGVCALLFVALTRLILTQRKFIVDQSFITLWYGFAITALLAALAEWLMISLVRFQAIPATPVILQTILVILIFPLPCWLLIRLQRAALTQG